MCGVKIFKEPKMGSAKWKLAAGFAATVIFVVLSHFFIDIPVALFCKKIDKSVTDIFEMITPLGISTWYLVGSFSLFLLFKFYYQRRLLANRVLFLFASISFSGIISTILKWLMGRFRPKVLFEENLYGFNFFSTTYEKNSFPSGHATTVFSLALALSIFFPKYRVLFLSYALIVAATRVVITAHYLSDAVGGAFVAIMTVFFLRKGIYFLERKGFSKLSI